MEGRDIGTFVFPDAEVKIYLDASPEERAARRAHDPAHQLPSNMRVEEVADALKARDHLDRTRAASPLKQAPDAVLVETTGIPVDEVIEQVVRIVSRKLDL
jgi:cytidylate kinase